MNRLILLPLLALLTGCVTHHHHYIQAADGQTVEVTDSVYDSEAAQYAEEPVVYTEERTVYTDYSADYSSVRYYPWWSVDYFYLSPYRRHNHVSVGFNLGFGSVWHDPFYWVYEPFSIAYSPFYYSYYYSPFRYRDYYGRGFNRYAYHDNYWRYRYNRHHRSGHHGHDDGERNRMARNQDGYGNYGRRTGGPDSFDNRRGRREDGRISPVDRGGDRPPGRQSLAHPGVNRHVSVAPGRQAGERGMEVRNRPEGKPVVTRTEPVKPIRKLSPASGVALVPPRPEDRVHQSVPSSAGEVRSYASSKTAPTRPHPVSPGYSDTTTGSSAGIRVPQSNKRTVDRTTQGYSTVRSPGQAKAGRTKVEPVRPHAVPQSYNSVTGPVIRVAPSQAQRATQYPPAGNPVARQSASPGKYAAPQHSARSGAAPSQVQAPLRSSPGPAPAVRQASPAASAPPRNAAVNPGNDRGEQSRTSGTKKDKRER